MKLFTCLSVFQIVTQTLGLVFSCHRRICGGIELFHNAIPAAQVPLRVTTVGKISGETLRVNRA